MFLGHFGVGFGDMAAAPQVSLGSPFLAAQFIDLLWPTLVMLGVERVRIISEPVAGPPLQFVHYPISHSLLSVLVWAGLFAAIYYAVRRSRIGALAWGGQAQWLLVIWGYWVDRHRRPPAMAGAVARSLPPDRRCNGRWRSVA